MGLAKALRAGLRSIACAVALASCAGGENAGVLNVPQAPPGNFDTVIVPGQRVGPVAMGGYVDEIVAKLGKPDRTRRSTFRGPGYDADEVYYYYDRYCLSFTWYDKGLRPQVQSGFRGIHATCNRWAMANGVRAGSSIQDVVRAMGEPHKVFGCKSGAEAECTLHYTSGVMIMTRDRNSPVFDIYIIPAGAH
jgi:hypothetical protein